MQPSGSDRPYTTWQKAREILRPDLEAKRRSGFFCSALGSNIFLEDDSSCRKPTKMVRQHKKFATKYRGKVDEYLLVPRESRATSDLESLSIGPLERV